MEMRFHVGTDPAVEERSHAYYQEKLFLMAEGSQKTHPNKTGPVQESSVKLKYSCSLTTCRGEEPCSPGWSTGATALLSSTVPIKLVTKRQQIQEGCLESPSNSFALSFV